MRRSRSHVRRIGRLFAQLLTGQRGRRDSGDGTRRGRHGLDDLLSRYLPARGFFVEAGAMDGERASNTYHLEMAKGWEGLLIEPNPVLAAQCVINRPRSAVIAAALVASDYSGKTAPLTLVADDSMSYIQGAALSQEHVRLSESTGTHIVDVPARTLTDVLRAHGCPEVDFLSLDVEGYELEVLRGLDLDVYAPRFILVECLTTDAAQRIAGHLGARYCSQRQLTHRDVLYCRG